MSDTYGALKADADKVEKDLAGVVVRASKMINLRYGDEQIDVRDPCAALYERLIMSLEALSGSWKHREMTQDRGLHRMIHGGKIVRMRPNGRMRTVIRLWNGMDDFPEIKDQMNTSGTVDRYTMAKSGGRKNG